MVETEPGAVALKSVEGRALERPTGLSHRYDTTAMTNQTPADQEPSGIDIEITVCANGVVNIHRPESDRAHSVILDVRGEIVHCSCKGHKFRGECAHADAIERRPLVVSSALAAAASYHDPEDSATTADAHATRAVADGGRVETTEIGADGGEVCDECGLSLDVAHEQPAGYTRLTTDGEKLCGACSDIRHGRDTRDRKTAEGLASEGSEPDTRGVVDPYADRVEERKNVDDTPL